VRTAKPSRVFLAGRFHASVHSTTSVHTAIIKNLAVYVCIISKKKEQRSHLIRLASKLALPSKQASTKQEILFFVCLCVCLCVCEGLHSAVPRLHVPPISAFWFHSIMVMFEGGGWWVSF
jgi:hypothetical protein